MRLAAILACAAAAGLAAPAGASAYDPASQPPFGGEPVPPLEAPESPDRRPPGFELTPAEAITIADHTDVVREERRESPGMEAARVHPRSRALGGQVLPRRGRRAHGGRPGPRRRPRPARCWRRGATTRSRPSWPAATTAPWAGRSTRRGSGSRSASSSCPVRRPSASAPAAPPRPAGDRRAERLAPLLQPGGDRGLGPAHVPGPRIPVRSHADRGAAPQRRAGPAGAARPAATRWRRRRSPSFLPAWPLNVVDSSVIDIGVAGVVGADRLIDGASLYEGVFAPGIDLRGDVYGPLNYLAYVPFELVWPWEGVWDDVPAAHAAAIAFDLACALGLLVLGRRLRPGGEGRGARDRARLRLARLPVDRLRAQREHQRRAGRGDDHLRRWSRSPLRPGAGRSSRSGPRSSSRPPPSPRSSPPGPASSDGARPSSSPSPSRSSPRWPSSPSSRTGDPESSMTGPSATRPRAAPRSASGGWRRASSRCRPAARAFAVILAVAAFLWPPRRSLIQVAALGAAVVIAAQVAGTHWFYFYVLWFLPLVLVAAFGECARITPRASSREAQASAS